MGIKRVEIKDFLVFKGEFSVDFSPGVNVIIGGNATGKTTLMKVLYRLCNPGRHTKTSDYFYSLGRFITELILFPFEYLKMQVAKDNDCARICIKPVRTSGKGGDDDPGDLILVNGSWISYDPSLYTDDYTNAKFVFCGDLSTELEFMSDNFRTVPSIYIPANHIVSFSKGIVELMDKYELDFDATQIDILRYLHHPMTRAFTPNCKNVIYTLGNLIDGEVLIDDGRFLIRKKSGLKVELALEASGIMRLSILWKLLRNGLLEPGSVLFWDEPENSLNPEYVPVLVDILLELSRNGVQVFIATHSELLASYFAVNRKEMEEAQFISLYKESDVVKANTGDRFDWLIPNNLVEEPVRLYEKQIERGLGK